MLAFLIVLYVLEANGLAVPTPCFVAAWVLIAVRLALSIFIGLTKK